jgi:outer membrane protein assembly factor BamB
MGNVANEDVVWCLDADTGKPKWSHKYPCKEGSYPGSRMTPTVDGNLVFSLSREGHLFCLDAKSGAVKWSKNVKKDFGVKNEASSWGLACSPLVVGDLLILDLGKILALKKTDGSLAWEAGKDAPGFASPCIFKLNGKTYVTSFNAAGLVVYDFGTHKEAARYEWKTKYDVNAATPIVAGDKIFISSGYDRGCTLLTFDGKSLKPVYENKTMRNHCNNSVLYKDSLFGIDGQHGSNGALKCMELATGKVKWTQSGIKPGGLMIADGKILAMLDGGELLVAEASADAFKALARVKVLNDQCWTYPVLSGGRIYCRSNKEKELVCIDVSGK